MKKGEFVQYKDDIYYVNSAKGLVLICSKIQEHGPLVRTRDLVAIPKRDCKLLNVARIVVPHFAVCCLGFGHPCKLVPNDSRKVILESEYDLVLITNQKKHSFVLAKSAKISNVIKQFEYDRLYYKAPVHLLEASDVISTCNVFVSATESAKSQGIVMRQYVKRNAISISDR